MYKKFEEAVGDKAVGGLLFDWGRAMARCLVETTVRRDTNVKYYCLIDTLFDKLVLYTSNKFLAESIEDKINRCDHIDTPYDIMWHDENTTFSKH